MAKEEAQEEAQEVEGCCKHDRVVILRHPQCAPISLLLTLALGPSGVDTYARIYICILNGIGK